MNTVVVIEEFSTSFGLCLKVKNDTEYSSNQMICSEKGDIFRIKSIQFPTTPQVTNAVILICDKI